MEMWFGLDDEVAACRRRSIVRHSRLDMSLLQEEFTTRRLERFKTLRKATGDNSTTEVDELKKNFRAMQEENYKLQAVITDVTEVNKRWQKYNNDRQMYVQRLLSTIQDQQEQMNKIVETRAFPSLKQVTSNDDNKNLQTLQIENHQLKEDVELLKKKIEQLQKEHKEHVEILEFQVKAHRDDWEAERSEKQQALQDKASMELRFKDLQKEVRSLRTKLKEERAQKQNLHCCGLCFGTNMCEGRHCGTGGKHCHRENAKTYRTSVHLPCATSQLLSRGASLNFGDDLVTDADEGDDINKPTTSQNETLRSRSSSIDETKLSPSPQDDDGTEISQKMSGATDIGSQKVKRTYPSEIAETIGKTLDLNIPPDDSSGFQYKCSVLHISPTNSGSNIATNDIPTDPGPLPANGVTIGFNSNGLASVTSFSQRQVVKSSSLPISEMINFDSEYSVKPTASQWSLDSGWSTVVGPPSSNNFARDALQDKKPFKMLSSGNLTKSEGNVTSTNVRNVSVPWKPKYFEEGVATQTREDVICPECGKVFPPTQHLKFLDHFEICQTSSKEISRRNNSSKLRK